MILKGKDLIVLVDGKAIAMSKSCTITVNADTIEYASPDQGKWKYYLAGRKSWSISTTHLVKADTKDATPLKEALARVGKSYTLRVTNSACPNDTVTGKANVTSAKVTATNGNLAQGSFTFKGSGPLE